MTNVDLKPLPRLRQGDILRDVEHIEYVREVSGVMEVSKVIFPLVVVLTQDCDLEQDYQSRESTSNQDKWLFSVLVAPLYNVQHMFTGSHLSELERTTVRLAARGTENNYLITNRNPRYHYLEFPDGVPIVPSVIDFKHYFSVDVTYLRNLKERCFVCSISELFREHLSQRFANFLARIGLPEIQAPQ